jgi:GPH family glycoside/pentoside/hexuronide:cation symporter
MTVIAPYAKSPGAETTKPATAAAAVRAKPLGWPLLGFYGLGGLGEHIPNYGLTHLLLFYLTIVCGMPGTAAGLLIGVSLVVDGVVEPLIGSLSDNSHSRHGRRHPFMLFGGLALAVTFGLLFSVPSQTTGVALYASALAILLAVRIAHAMFNVPFVALGAELTDDYHERSLVVASRLLFSQLAGSVASFLALGVFLKGHDGLTNPAGYAPFAWSSAALIAVMAGLSIVGTLGARDRLHAAAPNQHFAVGRFLGELVELFRNPSFRVLFFTALVFLAAFGIASGLGLHANKYFWKLTTQQILIVSQLAVASAIGGIVLAAALRRVMQKRTMAILGMGMVAISQLTLVPLRLAGLIPDDAVMAAVTISTMLTYAGMIINVVGFQSMMADVADHHEQLFGARREGLCYSGTTLATKVSSGLGAMVAGLTLDIIGFPHVPRHAKAALVIPAETLRHLALVYGPATGALTVVAIILVFNYRLNKDEHMAIRSDLVRQRNEGTSI